MTLDIPWLEQEVFRRRLTAAERQALAAAVEVLFVPGGMPIIHQGTEGKALYLLRSGSAKALRKTQDRTITLSTNIQSHVFGEISLFSGEAVTAEVIADTDCIVYKIGREALRRLMQMHSELALDLLAFVIRNMGEVIRRLDARLANRR